MIVTLVRDTGNSTAKNEKGLKFVRKSSLYQTFGGAGVI
jgi:hypothetical protein